MAKSPPGGAKRDDGVCWSRCVDTRQRRRDRVSKAKPHQLRAVLDVNKIRLMKGLLTNPDIRPSAKVSSGKDLFI